MSTSASLTHTDRLSDAELTAFQTEGFLIVRGMVREEIVSAMRDAAYEGLARHVGPLEYEVDVQYPGSPESITSPGGRTVRRLKNAFARGPVFTEWVTDQTLGHALRSWFGEPVVMPMAHHNCIMTKHPQHSSETGWHQDIRFWSYEHPDLINAWIALTEETPEQGSLKLLPKSHALTYTPNQFDAERFLRTDAEENAELLATAVDVNLEPGDVVFFHARTFHAADRNHTSDLKLSAVFTFRGASNRPLPGSRSASLPEVCLPEPRTD